MASSISGQATLKHHAFSSLPNCVQRVAPWNILFTCCGVSISAKSASVRLSSRSKASSSIGSMDTDRQKSSGPQLCKMATRAGSLLCAASRGQDGPLRHNNATSARRTLSGEEVILFAPSFNWAGAAQGITVIHVARRGVAGRFSRGGVVAGDFGGVGWRSGDAVSAGSGEARSQSWIQSRGCGEREEGE